MFPPPPTLGKRCARRALSAILILLFIHVGFPLEEEHTCIECDSPYEQEEDIDVEERMCGTGGPPPSDHDHHCIFECLDITNARCGCYGGP